MQNTILYTSIFFTGITFTCTLFMILFSSKNIGTRFHAIFFSYLTLFLICLVLSVIGIKLAENIINRLNYFIPAFYVLFLLVQHNNKFKWIFLLFFLIPIPFVFLPPRMITSLLFHFISWTLLFTITIKLYKPETPIEKENHSKFKLLVAILIGLSIIPFIVINFIAIFFYKINSMSMALFPPALAITAMLDFYYSYKSNFLVLDHSYYANIDFIKKSMAMEKKTLIEKFSASLIHEIKNPLTAIQSINQQLLSKIDNMEKKDIIKYLDVISDETDRIKDLAENYLKNFRTGINGKNELINLFDIISSIINLIKPELLKHNCIIDIDKSSSNTNFYFNNSEFRQIIINLLYNAIEADASKIQIYSQKKELVNEIFIKDNGCGIKLDHESIFRPFTTSKLDGTGLGLSISKEILNSYYGQLEIYKSDNSGTTFKISIPEKNINENFSS